MRTVWHNGHLSYERTKIMGILNVTPDSFSDGGRYSNVSAADHAFRMIDEGADIIDVGGESTRPGFVPVPPEVEMERVVNVIRMISRSSSVPVSVDTMKPEVAEKAVEAGAVIINDIQGSDKMIDVALDFGVAMILMHAPFDIRNVHGTNMQGDVIEMIRSSLTERAEHAIYKGMSKDSLMIDPGIGFGKTPEQNTLILNNIKEFTGDFPVLVGASRKRFLSNAFPGVEREQASLLAAKTAKDNGASILRVHNVKGTIDIITKKEDTISR